MTGFKSCLVFHPRKRGKLQVIRAVTCGGIIVMRIIRVENIQALGIYRAAAYYS
jgi:hypothetical protein